MKSGDINLKDLFHHKQIQFVVDPVCRLIKKWTPVFTDKWNDLASRFAFNKKNALLQPLIKPQELSSNNYEPQTYSSCCSATHQDVSLSQFCGYSEPQEFSSNIDTQDNNEPQISRSYCATNHSDISLCRFCGLELHLRSVCPARQSSCQFCYKRGHFADVCERRARLSKYQMAPEYHVVPDSKISSMHRVPNLSTAITDVTINKKTLKALVDTGSTDSFINEKVANELNLTITPQKKEISLASSSSTVSTIGSVNVGIQINNHTYNDFKLDVLPNLCCDLILGHDLFVRHSRLVLNFNGRNSEIVLPQATPNHGQGVCSIAQAIMDPPSIFSHLTPDCHPIACKSRKYSLPEQQFIKNEVKRLLSADVIEPSHSPWRAQLLVCSPENHKRRLVVDYSRTINKFTQLDAYPLPKIDELALKVSQYKVYSALDLRSAYHQIPLRESDREYTAFEADGKLYHFKRIPFGVTNGVSAFQRIMDELVERHNLSGTFVYLDNITICGKDQQEHDRNLQNFYNLISQYGLTLNQEKSVLSVSEIQMLGYLISYGSFKPDPERMRPLLELPVPHNPKSLKRALGMFSYYSQYVPKFSDKIQPLTGDPEFPLTRESITAFEDLKSCITHASMASPNDTDMLILETDASEMALSACLNQNGRPVAFFSRTLQPHERRHSSVEKEAAAIVEAIRKWRHYLVGRKFKLIIDQQAVSFIFNVNTHGKIKNNKLLRWRIELSCYEFDIQYRPGKENVTADCLTRTQCSAINANQKLKELHDGLCHPGITRFYHFVRSRNLPYSMDDIKSVVNQCRVCAKVKPNFFKPKNPPLIKATQPFERLAIDFKGPLPSVTANKYLLVIVDEFSRFTFAYACKDMTAKTVITHLNNLFSVFGITSYVHSDNGPSLICDELRDYLYSLGVAYSNSTRYNPRGNGQVERYNGTVWKACQLATTSRGLQISQWEEVLPAALHSIRTLLCVSTNTTPHERLFGFQRRTVTGHTLPSWLMSKGTVLLRKHARTSKYDPICEEVELLDATPTYAKVKFDSGREQTVSLRDLAPLPSYVITNEVSPDNNGPELENHRHDSPPQPVHQTAFENDSAAYLPPQLTINKPDFTRNVFNMPSTIHGDLPENDNVPDVALRKSSRNVVKPQYINYDQLGGTN